MSRLQDIGDRDGWRCWLCDEVVDAAMSVNDSRGPSVDNLTTKAKAQTKSKDAVRERLAHRGCNTMKGAIAPVVPWPDDLFVFDPAPILASVERLQHKKGREVVARCPTTADANSARIWLADRVTRLASGVEFKVEVEPGGGQFLLILRC